jgi:cellulose synthase/poly-beta-1,6-N-acetylglucosamine synthase-like glycosyltransferase
MPTDIRYVLISPYRDEASYVRRAMDSVERQSVPLALWAVVDDGSTDETPAILDEYKAVCSTSASRATRIAADAIAPEFRRFLDVYQRVSLLQGNRTATRTINERQRATWHKIDGSPLPLPGDGRNLQCQITPIS